MSCSFCLTGCLVQDRMEALEVEYNQVQGDFDSCAKRFGEDPTKTKSADFFALVSVRNTYMKRS